MVRQAGVTEVETFGRVVKELLAAKRLTQDALAAMVSDVLGADPPFSQGKVSKWLNYGEGLTPTVVFAIERALKEPEGTLSRILGFIPVSADARAIELPPGFAYAAQEGAKLRRIADEEAHRPERVRAEPSGP